MPPPRWCRVPRLQVHELEDELATVRVELDSQRQRCAALEAQLKETAAVRFLPPVEACSLRPRGPFAYALTVRSEGGGGLQRAAAAVKCGDGGVRVVCCAWRAGCRWRRRAWRRQSGRPRRACGRRRSSLAAAPPTRRCVRWVCDAPFGGGRGRRAALQLWNGKGAATWPRRDCGLLAVCAAAWLFADAQAALAAERTRASALSSDVAVLQAKLSSVEAQSKDLHDEVTDWRQRCARGAATHCSLARGRLAVSAKHRLERGWAAKATPTKGMSALFCECAGTTRRWRRRCA